MARNSVKISVIMPAYNVAPYIDEAIRSVLAQQDISFEFLIGDDASTDNTWDRIRSYQTDPKVRAWRFSHNRGECVVRNFLITRALSPYISFCDADDLLMPGFLKTLVNVLKRNAEIGVVYGDMIERRSHQKDRILRRSRGPVKTWDLIDGSISHIGTLVRKSLIQKVGWYRPEYRFLGDVDLFFRLAEITEFRYLPGKPLYIYRRRPDSLSNQPKEKWVSVGQKIVKDAIFRRYGVEAKW